MGASAKPKSRREPAVGSPLPHDSAHLHVTGQASYTDDLPEPRDLLHVAVGMSSVAHANVASVDLTAVLAAPGVVEVCVASDISWANNYGPIIADDTIFATDLVQ
jgi:xanthine dehydrogenase large subunit